MCVQTVVPLHHTFSIPFTHNIFYKIEQLPSTEADTFTLSIGKLRKASSYGAQSHSGMKGPLWALLIDLFKCLLLILTSIVVQAESILHEHLLLILKITTAIIVESLAGVPQRLHILGPELCQ